MLQTDRIGFLGASPPMHLIRRCIDIGVFDVLQVAYSLVDRGPEANVAAAETPFDEELLQAAVHAGE